MMQCRFTAKSVGVLVCEQCGAELESTAEPSRVHRRCKKSRGLGDTVAKITAAVGIKPCGGCKDRQETLNKWFPYR